MFNMYRVEMLICTKGKCWICTRWKWWICTDGRCWICTNMFKKNKN